MDSNGSTLEPAGGQHPGVPGGGEGSRDLARNRVTQFPRNQSFLLVQKLPGQDGKCTFGEVRPIPGGRYFVASLDWLSETKSPEPSAEETRGREQERANRIKAMEDEEVRSGKCSEAHVNFLRQGLSALANYLQTSTRSANNPDVFELGAHAFAVGTDTITPWSLAMGIGGEEHIFAVAFAPFGPTGTTFEVVDDQGYPVKTPSRLAQMVFTAFNQPTTGYVLQANAHQTLKMNLKGHGCVLLVAIRRD